MTFVWLTFAVTLAIVLGAYWAFVVRPETQDKDQLSGRLRTSRSRRRTSRLRTSRTQGADPASSKALLKRQKQAASGRSNSCSSNRD